MRRVCLVTSGNLASNPRLVKEAAALRDAGYAVRIVAADIIPSLAPFDPDLIDALGVPCLRIPVRRPRVKRLARAIRQRGAKAIAALTPSNVQTAVSAQHQLSGALAEGAARDKADLYIAHNLAALPVAAKAAERYRAKLGFDAEDYHSGELEETVANKRELSVRRVIERHFLPKCDYVTASSPQIAAAYAPFCAVSPEVILNVFPVADAPFTPLPEAERKPRSLYWFSQTIGPGRGIELVIAAMKKMDASTSLYLQGTPASAYENTIRDFATENAVAERIHFLSPAPPRALVRLCSQYALGIAFELNEPPNRSFCLTNKIFTYLLGGIPVLLSRTVAQEALAGELGEAAILVDPSPDQIALETERFLSDAARQQRSRHWAWQLGRERYNWEVESQTFLQLVRGVLR